MCWIVIYTYYLPNIKVKYILKLAVPQLALDTINILHLKKYFN